MPAAITIFKRYKHDIRLTDAGTTAFGTLGSEARDVKVRFFSQRFDTSFTQYCRQSRHSHRGAMEQVYFHLRRDNGCEFGNGRSRQCYCISICRDNWSLGVTEQSRSGVDGTMRWSGRPLTQQVVESLASPMRD